MSADPAALAREAVALAEKATPGPHLTCASCDVAVGHVHRESCPAYFDGNAVTKEECQ